jgi:cell division protein FtsB
MTDQNDITDTAPKKKGPNVTPLVKAKNDFRSLKMLHEAQCLAVTGLEKDNEKLRARIIFLETTLQNVERLVEINKTMLRDSITTSQQQVDHMATEIQLLKAEITKLKAG